MEKQFDIQFNSFQFTLFQKPIFGDFVISKTVLITLKGHEPDEVFDRCDIFQEPDGSHEAYFTTEI
jgi:hypothetical protein